MIYVVTDREFVEGKFPTDQYNSLDIDKYIEEIKRIYGEQEIWKSMPIPKPSSPELTNFWEREIIRKELDMIKSADFVVFDSNCKDRVGMLTMIGMASVLGTKFIVLEDETLNSINSLGWKENELEKNINVRVLKELIEKGDTYGEFILKLDDNDPMSFILLGAICAKELDIQVESSRNRLVINKMVQRFVVK